MLKTMYDYRKYASYEAYADAMKEEEKKRAEEWEIAVRTNKRWEKAKQEGRLIPRTVERVKNFFGDDEESYMYVNPAPAMNKMNAEASRFIDSVHQQPVDIYAPKGRVLDYNPSDYQREMQQINTKKGSPQLDVVQPRTPSLMSENSRAAKKIPTATTSAFGYNYQAPYPVLQNKTKHLLANYANLSTPWYSVPETIDNFLHQPEQPQVNRRDPLEITRAAENAVAFVINGHGKVDAACNVGVISAFKQLHNNSTELDGMMANDMARYWSNDTSGRWEQVSMEDTQALPNRGEFVVAAWENPNQGRSGHVVVIVPGEMEYSGSWKTFVPQAMDTGGGMRESKHKLTNNFGEDKKATTKYYKYNPE